MKSHWEKIYTNSSPEKLGWYEEIPEPSLQLIEKCHLDKDAVLLNVGAGATTLVDKLLNLGYTNIIANDISESALEKLKASLGKEKSQLVRWLIDDLTHPTELNKFEQVDLWHDRAVLHFFNEPEDQDTYFNLLKKLLKKAGFVIIATFKLDGTRKCSGLPVTRYDESMIMKKLGLEFALLEAFNYTYLMPSGDTREYVYTLFQRKS